MDQLGVGDKVVRGRYAVPATVRRELLAGPFLTQEAGDQREQILHLRRPPPERLVLPAPRTLEHVDEEGGLAVLDRPLVPRQRQADVEPDIREQAPQEGVRDLVQ